MFFQRLAEVRAAYLEATVRSGERGGQQHAGGGCDAHAHPLLPIYHIAALVIDGPNQPMIGSNH